MSQVVPAHRHEKTAMNNERQIRAFKNDDAQWRKMLQTALSCVGDRAEIY